MKPRLEALAMFERLLGHAAEERAGLLAAWCAADPELRAEVELLLAHDAPTADDPLAGPCLGAGFHVVDAAERAARPIRAFPCQVGRYRVLAEIGAGAMGVVYRAEQDRPRRVLALKILVRGSPVAAGVDALVREAQAQALLTHPGIAHVYDAGLLRVDGVDYPFLAMEWIDGEPLLAWAAATGADFATRLRTMVQVCDAVHAAHQRGVIHRDLKSSNILVQVADGVARPRLLDFGIASLPSERTAAPFAGTLAHMSPEQARGDTAVDVRSDVYSLASLTFELLTGTVPIPTAALPLRAALQRVDAGHPLRLSDCEPRLAGDLERVLEVALAKAPEDRHASARELGADFARVLERRPVSVRAPTWRYLAGCFARRQRFVCAALAVAVLAVGAAVGVGWWFHCERAAEREQLLGLSRFTDSFVDELRRIAGASSVRALALEGLLPRVDAFLGESPDDVAMLTCRANILRQLGDIEVDAQRWGPAKALRERALAAQAQLLTSGGDLARAEWATALVRVGDIQAHTVGPAAARGAHEHAHAVFTELAAAHPDDARHLDDLAWSCDRIAHAAIDRGEYERAEELLRRREALLGRLRVLRAGCPTVPSGECAVQCLWAHLATRRGQLDEASRRLSLAIAAARAHRALKPASPQAAIELGSSLASYVVATPALAADTRTALVAEARDVLGELLVREPGHAVARALHAQAGSLVAR